MLPISAFPESLQQEAEEKAAAFNKAMAGADLKPLSSASVTENILPIFACSKFISDNCTRYPELLPDLADSGDLSRVYARDEYRQKLSAILESVEGIDHLQAALRRFRRRELIRIAWRDLSGEADLMQTVAEISAFADTCIDLTLTILEKKLRAELGTPVNTEGIRQRLVVIGMGKLGGRELNFSSDIDLIFAYPESGQTQGGTKSVSNEEFFARLCRQLIQVLGKITADGIVFRVDMRLRPFGDGGPLAMVFDAMENYYQLQGREWERYAWIKARDVAGDPAAGAALLERMNPFVYRRYLDYGAFESLRDMKRKITLEVRRKEMQRDIKLGAGGIREIEFFGQVFQLIRGGVKPFLQRRRILVVLALLQQEGYIPSQVGGELEQGYLFLRNLEHRLQEYADQQTHQLPVDSTEMARLALSMGFGEVDAFQTALDLHRRNVHYHFAQLLEAKESESADSRVEGTLQGIWQGLIDPAESERTLESIGLYQPDDILRLLEHLRDQLLSRKPGKEATQRLDKLIPLLILTTTRSQDQPTALNRIFDLIRAIGGRASYLALLLENPESLEHLIELTDASSLIASFLTRHPVLLDELLDPRTLYRPPDRTELETELGNRIERFPDDLEIQMEELRIFRQINTLRIAAADVARALPLMRVSDHLSDLAETVVNEVLELAWNHLRDKYGRPVCRLEDRKCDKGFVVIAYGKLGGLELGYGSDIDLVFLHAGTAEATRGTEHSIDNSLFFARLGQRVLHMLTAHTQAGIVYETDMRLRPSGSSGMLVSHIEGFRDYQLNEAWTWEHQALIRARAIGGDPLLVARFEEIRREVLSITREDKALRQEVSKMRHRMRKELLKHEPDTFDLKQGLGGMVDIEFLVQYLVLREASLHPPLLRWTDNVRLLQSLMESGIVNENLAHILRHAYLIYRADGHRLSLQEKPARVPTAKFERLSSRVSAIWDSYLE